MAIVVAVALVINRTIGPDDHPWSVWAALAILLVSATVSAATGSIGEWDPINGRSGWWILLLGVISLPFLGIRHVDAHSDYTNEPLDVRRVSAVRADGRRCRVRSRRPGG